MKLLALASSLALYFALCSAVGTLHTRSYFYAGEQFSPFSPSNGTVAHGQIYVERLTPAKVTQALPLVFIHGRGMTGTNFLNTPDGREGWADFFLSKGFEVFIIDQPARARSAWFMDFDGPQTTTSVEVTESHFTAVQLFKLWSQASLHTQWPGNGTQGDPVFDNFYASTMPSLTSELDTSRGIVAAGPLVIDKIGPHILITHSQGGQLGWILGDARPSQVKSIIAIEPIGPPFIDAVFDTNPMRPFGVTEVPLTFSPPIRSSSDLKPVAISHDPSTNFTCFQLPQNAQRKLVNLAHIPTLVITSESSYHAVYDGCTAEFLRRADVPVQHVHLEDVGIHGNGHMMFMEKNNLQIAEQVLMPWIKNITG